MDLNNRKITSHPESPKIVWLLRHFYKLLVFPFWVSVTYFKSYYKNKFVTTNGIANG